MIKIVNEKFVPSLYATFWKKNFFPKVMFLNGSTINAMEFPGVMNKLQAASIIYFVSCVGFYFLNYCWLFSMLSNRREEE